MENIEQHAADILLDRGVAWEVPAPRIFRIVGVRKVKIPIKALKLGTLLEVSRRYAALNIKAEDIEKDPWKLINGNLIPVCRITAVCVLNSRLNIRLFTRILAHFIRWRFTGNMLLEVMIFIANFSGMASFTSTIGLIRDLRITVPKNPSPEDQGS